MRVVNYTICQINSFSSGIFLGLLLLKVDGDDMKMNKRRRR
jgi:hypothetical protein